MLPDVVRRLGLGPDAVIEPAAGGASGSAWKVRAAGDTYVLRLESSTALTDARLAAMATALAAGLPAPRLIRRVTTAEVDAVLLSWLPGRSLYDVLVDDPTGTRRWGRLMGEIQRRLHGLVAPTAVIDVLGDGVHPFAAGGAVADLPVGDALLHLDWHPLHLLVDEASRISGIIDWDNARRGHPSLDLARTHSLLTVEPSIASLPEGIRSHLDELVEAWVDGYGQEAGEIPAVCHAWAGRVMLADLEPRYAASPTALDRLRRWTEAWLDRS